MYTYKIRIIQASFAYVLFVFFLISFKDLFNRAKHSLESFSINADNSSWCNAFHTCLSRSVSDQSNLSKIITFFELEYFFRLFLCDKSSFCDHVKLIPLLALFYDILSYVVALFFQDIAKLFSFIWVYLR
jgi:hypothetical protein